MKYTSQSLSKWLQEKGFKGESDYYYVRQNQAVPPVIINKEGLERLKKNWGNNNIGHIEYYPAYDILNDLSVKYAKELFGDALYPLEFDGKYIYWKGDNGHQYRPHLPAYKFHSSVILKLLQQGKKEEAEDYIRSNCVFTLGNKEEKIEEIPLFKGTNESLNNLKI